MVAPVLAGCASTASGVTSAVLDKIFEPGSTAIEASIVAAEDLNPDYDGQASPLVVRMYELKTPTAFNNASFFALYDSDVAELGDDLKGKEEIELRPGEKLELERELQPETRFVGFIGEYRDIENASWRAVAEVSEGETTDLEIDFGRLAIKIVNKD
jgi:type VI secretion system protein VasD